MNTEQHLSGNQLLEILFQSPNATAVYTGENIVVQHANQAMLDLWKKDKTVIGKPLESAVPELKGQPYIDILKKVWSSGIAYTASNEVAELFYEGKLQSFYFDFVYQPLKNVNDEVYCILHTASDVTSKNLHERVLRRAWESERALLREKVMNEELAASNEELAATNEELQHMRDNLYELNAELEQRVERRTFALVKSEIRSRSLLNAMPQQVWTATPGGVLDYVNQIVANDFGYESLAILDMGWKAFIHPDDLRASTVIWEKALKSGAEYMVEFRLRFRNGEYIWHLARAVPLFEDGNIKLWLGTNTNIAAQKINEHKKDEFLSIASHELKTPLTSIKAFNQLMQKTTPDERLGNFVKRSAENIMRLERLINDLLDVTKINAGKMNYNMEPFSFSQMLLDSVENVRHAESGHEITIENLIDITYTGDRFRLEQVMQNFLSNAIKYSPAGTKIVINSKTEQGNIIVSVQDFGIGIAEDHLDRLFDRYYRVDNTAMRFEGLGLGLFISSEILKRHNGSFWIESKPGQGSTFYFRLPVSEQIDYRPVIKTDIFYQDDHITLSYNQTENRLDADWTGFQQMESVKNGCKVMLDLVHKNHCYKIVNDNSHVTGTWSEASEWVGEVFFKELDEHGVKYLAWVFSPSAFSQLSAKKSIDVAVGNVTTRFFTELALAEAWINSLH